jgi:hypothetical protein
MKTTVLVSVLCVSMSGCWLSHKKWISDRESIGALGALDEVSVARAYGEPDYRMGMLEFIQHLNNDPCEYVNVHGERFRSYRDYVIYQMTAGLINRHAFADGWYSRSPYSACTVWVYDESCHYRRPYFATWCCVVVAFNHGRVANLFPIHDWHPSKWGMRR